MTDKVQKIKEWIQTRKLCTMDEHMKFYCKEAESDYNLLCSIEKILDSLQEEPASSKDLEEEITLKWSKFCLNGKDRESFVRVAKHFFELGLKVQKEE